MGWWAEEALGHEGSKVGVLKLDDGLTGTRYLATVDAPDPSVTITSIHYALAACDCGWRSERICVAESMAWIDGWLECSERVNARLERLWVEHIALVSYRVRLAQVPMRRDRHTDELIASLESVERCQCGHERYRHTLVNCTASGTFAPPIDGPSDVPTVGCPCREFRFMPTPA